jgi:hypothetical protein
MTTYFIGGILKGVRMENTKLIKKIKEYLDADIKDNNDLNAQAYAEQLMFWIENWEEIE